MGEGAARTTWTRLTRLGVRRDGDLRRVGLRLAVQTVGLLLVMLLILEGIVFVITQHTLLNSLEGTLKNRAHQVDPHVCQDLGLSCAQGGPVPDSPGAGPGGQPQGGTNGLPPPHNGSTEPQYTISSNPNEASAVYIDTHDAVFHADGSNAARLLYLADAERALATHKAQCCSTHGYKGQDYLAYTEPISASGKIVGAVQTNISEHQYQGTLNSLLQALLIVALLGLLVSAAISAVLTQRALRPIRVAVQRQRDFVADAAHELRTPLAIMRTVGEVGMAAPSADDLQATIAQMLGENQHLTRLVDDLSLLARTDTNAVSIERKSVDLSAMISDTTAELGWLAEEQGVTLRAEIGEGVIVVGDILRLRQLLLILLDNALKHTPAGGAVQVRLSVHGGRAHLQVIDSGPGIPAADLPRIFDRFYRADQARTGEGSGLGLAIGKWIVEAHGGHIQAENAHPHGADFTVTLPVARARALAQQVEPHAPITAKRAK